MWPILFRRVEKGVPCKPLDTQPLLFPDLNYTWNAFWTLSNARTYSESGPNAIAIAEISAYLVIFPMGDKQQFVQNIYLLDSAYLQYSRKRIDSEREQADKSP